METRFKMAATQRQMNYLLSDYGVKLCERMDKEEPKFPIPGEANVYLWKVLLRHPEGLSIPSLIGYSKLLPMLSLARRMFFLYHCQILWFNTITISVR